MSSSTTAQKNYSTAQIVATTVINYFSRFFWPTLYTSETLLCELFEESLAITIHAMRETVILRDIQIVTRMQKWYKYIVDDVKLTT